MIKIKQQFIECNFESNGLKEVLNITIHDTANTKKGADAQAHYGYFNNPENDASAHYVVDDTEIIQLVRHEDRAWHIGGDKNNKNNIFNSNSIGIEICVNVDGDYELAVQNAIDLTVALLQMYPSAKLVRHYDAWGKICPKSMSDNNWQKWYEFVSDVEEELEELANPVEDWKITPIKNMLNYGILTSKEWKTKADEPAPVWMVCTMLDRIMNLKDIT
jgi:N-acetylmuramoyl-L-alanine amidase